MEFFDKFISNTINSINKIDISEIKLVINELKYLKNNSGRLFVAGVGGSAANASHLTNDFRKLTSIETYCISDNISELTARINDDSWENSYKGYLEISKFNSNDVLLILSVGGGSKEKKVSLNLVEIIDYAILKKAKSIAVVSNLGGYAKEKCDYCITINVDDKSLITPISETLQAYVWHLLVSHEQLKSHQTKW